MPRTTRSRQSVADPDSKVVAHNARQTTSPCPSATRPPGRGVPQSRSTGSRDPRPGCRRAAAVEVLLIHLLRRPARLARRRETRLALGTPPVRSSRAPQCTAGGGAERGDLLGIRMPTPRAGDRAFSRPSRREPHKPCPAVAGLVPPFGAGSASPRALPPSRAGSADFSTMRCFLSVLFRTNTKSRNADLGCLARRRSGYARIRGPGGPLSAGKGKREPVPAHELLGPHDAPGSVRVHSRPRFGAGRRALRKEAS